LADWRGGILSTNPIEGDERKRELAQMLGGVSAGTLKSVDEMLAAVKEQTCK
jgi:hypothetical protein